MHENTQFLNQFQDNIVYYKCYTDNILGVWLETSANIWQNIKTRLNQFEVLQWNVDNLNTSNTFLDLQISIKDSKIQTTTY